MNYKKITAELIHAMRGSKSQTKINQKLRVGYNLVSKWETEQTRVKWHDFLRYAELTEKDIAKAMARFFGYRSDIQQTAQLMHFLKGYRSINQLAAAMGCSRSTVSGLLNGKSTLYLDAFLSMVDQNLRLLTVVDFLAGNRELPSLVEHRQQLDRLGELYGAYPEAFLITTFMRLDQYRQGNRHSDAVVSKALGIDKNRVKEIVKKLCDIGAIEMSQGHYALKFHEMTGSRGVRGYENGAKLKRYWADMAAKRLGQSIDHHYDSWFAVASLAIGKEGWNKVVELLGKLAIDIKDVEQSIQEKKEFGYILNIQMLLGADDEKSFRLPF